MEKPTKSEICCMLTELLDNLHECGVPAIRADYEGDYTTALIVPACYITEVRKILEEGEHPATVEDHMSCGLVKAVF